MSTEIQPTNKKNLTRRITMLVAVLLAAVFLYLAFRDVDWSAMWSSLQGGRYEFFLIVLCISSINLFIRASRWRVLLLADKQVPIGAVFASNNLGYFGNYFLPARAGELIRSAAVGRLSGAGTSFSLATALTERVMDAILLVLISITAIISMNNLPDVLITATRSMAVVGLIALVGILLAPRLEKQIKWVINKIPLPEKIKQPLISFLERFLLGMHSLQNPVRLLSFLGFSAVIWSLDAVSATLVGAAFNMSISVPLAFIILAALGLSSAIPSTPGYVGVYQFVAVAVLTPFGYSKSDALVFILSYQLLSYVFTGFWGLMGFWKLGFNRDTLKSLSEGQ
ncbi:MAG: flippase-like domain-containing protein [Anaerolineae bacterium]|nr:flippase-like domain-containing protein [Anaerolineae bacterium]